MRTYYNIFDQLNTTTIVWILRNTSARVWCTQRHRPSLTYTLKTSQPEFKRIQTRRPKFTYTSAKLNLTRMNTSARVSMHSNTLA